MFPIQIINRKLLHRFSWTFLHSVTIPCPTASKNSQYIANNSIYSTSTSLLWLTHGTSWWITKCSFRKLSCIFLPLFIPDPLSQPLSAYMVSLPLVTFFAQGPVTLLTLYIVVITSMFWQSYLFSNLSRSSGKIQTCIPVEFRKLKFQPVAVTVWSKA